MTYDNMSRAVFLARPNRFTADIELGGERVRCHVKNTGRCRELLVPGAEIYVQRAASPGRRTDYDLISVRKGERLVNMDSAAPNRVFAQWLSERSGLAPEYIRPECRFGDSRFDFYFEHGDARAFAEVKGVTLERDGTAIFPDAPTERGVKHLRGLIQARRQGFEAWAAFIIQLEGVARLVPNRETHPAFGEALRDARAAGVTLMALDCRVTETAITAREPVELVID